LLFHAKAAKKQGCKYNLDNFGFINAEDVTYVMDRLGLKSEDMWEIIF
jgi:hypothetical protein